MTAREFCGFTALTQSSQRKAEGTEEATGSTARSSSAVKGLFGESSGGGV